MSRVFIILNVYISAILHSTFYNISFILFLRQVSYNVGLSFVFVFSLMPDFFVINHFILWFASISFQTKEKIMKQD